jgi:hypothetical protein
MQGLLRSKSLLGMATLLLIAALAISFSVTGTLRTYAAPATRLGNPGPNNPQGNLDCNGFSATGQQLFRSYQVCADLNNVASEEPGGRPEDNGHYIGHDEPSVQFTSTLSGSGNNLQYSLTLPTERSLPATQTFENMPAFWFSLALCDPRSYPQGSCTPDSDSNNPNRAGSAFMELQFYPPGFAPFISQISCDKTHWCAALNIDSLECSQFFGCNSRCEEPVNFAFIQTNGVPTGPPGPAKTTSATFTPNAQTLLMNQGDKLTVTIQDSSGNTSGGVTTTVKDVTTGNSGFMIASAANGFQNTNVLTCSGTNFSFHPEYSTAKVGNVVPWAALSANVGFAIETGHFEVGTNGDSDSDDAPCFATSSVSILAGCIGADLDFDGTSYHMDWPDGTTNNATSLQVTSPHFGTNYTSSYPSLQFETDIAASESACQSNGTGCVVPPPGAAFYPYYSVTTTSSPCVFLFGNNTTGVNSLGQDAQYGTPTSRFSGTLSSGQKSNPC